MIDRILEDAPDLISESADGTARVSTIVNGLKNFSHIADQELKASDINQCLEETLNVIWNELKYKVTLSKEYGDLPLTHCYPLQLNQVFMNLLINASQSIEDQGQMMIKTWMESEVIYITITDSGCGIEQDNIPKLFEPFSTTKEVGKGTGLGLSISYEIIKKHNGKILVASEPGRGTTFTITLPVRS